VRQVTITSESAIVDKLATQNLVSLAHSNVKRDDLVEQVFGDSRWTRIRLCYIIGCDTSFAPRVRGGLGRLLDTTPGLEEPRAALQRLPAGGTRLFVCVDAHRATGVLHDWTHYHAMGASKQVARQLAAQRKRELIDAIKQYIEKSDHFVAGNSWGFSVIPNHRMYGKLPQTAETYLTVEGAQAAVPRLLRSIAKSLNKRGWLTPHVEKCVRNYEQMHRRMWYRDARKKWKQDGVYLFNTQDRAVVAPRWPAGL
jgi:hypothetical protein